MEVRPLAALFSMEVEAYIRLSQEGELTLLGHDAVVQQLINNFLPRGGDIMLKARIGATHRRGKTSQQMGYMMGHLAPLALQYLQNCGWGHINTKEQAVHFLKPDIGLQEMHINDFTGMEVVKDISLADASLEQLNKAIVLLTIILLEAGFEVMSPEEYKKGKKWASKE